MIPEVTMAITNGDPAAFPVPLVKSGLLDGTSNPMTVTPPM